MINTWKIILNHFINIFDIDKCKKKEKRTFCLIRKIIYIDYFIDT